MKKFLYMFLAFCSFSGSGFSAITWSAPLTISTVSNDASDPYTVIDSAGNATAVWVENSIVKASSLPFGGSWSAPVTLSNPAQTSSKPLLGVDSSGNITAVWISNTVATVARLPFGGSWSASSAISGSGASQPALVVNAAGTVVAVWTRNGSIESSTRTLALGLWSLVAVLSAVNSDHPQIAINNNGTAIAVWHSVVAGSDALYSALLNVSLNVWGLPLSVFSQTTAYFHDYPKVAIDETGNAVLAWFRYNFAGNAYSNVQVLSTSLSKNASAWGVMPTFLSNNGIRNPNDLFLKVSFDANGNALAVWTNSYDGEIFNTESSKKLFGGIWEGFTILFAPTAYSFGMDLAVILGNGLATNMSWDGISTIAIQSQETDTANPISAIWTITNPFSTGQNNAYPHCAITAIGSAYNAVAVWVNFDGTHTIIKAVTGSGQQILPPSSVAATQNVTNFGVFQDYYNTVTWLPSSDPGLIQYNIYRNGVLFSATDPSTLQIVDHNQIQGGTVKYGVAAFTSEFRQSSVVTYTLFP